MANSRVEIISGQLAGTVLENAASEATLRDLVNSINKMNVATSRGAARGAGNPAAAMGGLSAASSTLSKSFDSVGKSLNRFSKGAVGAMSGLTATLLKGSEKLSDYTKVLNDELIANIPIVGGALSGLGNVITSSIQTFESWNDSLKQATQFGASFNNNLLLMRQAAGEAYLGLDDFVAILRENREGLIGLGGTATRGAKAFGKVASDLMKPGGLGTTLVDMGYSVEAVQGGLARFLTTTMKGTRFEMMNSARLAELSGKYLINLDKITKLTGKSAEQQENDMQVASQDSMFRLEMMKLGVDERAKMEAGLAEFTARFGPAGAELFKQVALGMPPLTTNTQLLSATMPGAVDAVLKLQRSAKNTSIDMDQYSQMSNETMADAVMSAMKSYGSLEQILKAGAAGAEGTASQIYEAYGPILKQIANLGGSTEITRDRLIDLAKQAQQEQKDREEITTSLNQFGLASRQIRNELQLVLIEAVKSLSSAFGNPNGEGGLAGAVKFLSEGFKEFTEKTLMPLAKDVGPALKKFITMLSSEEGRNLIVDNIKRLFEHVILEVQHAIGKNNRLARLFGIGISTEEYEQEKARLDGEAMQSRTGPVSGSSGSPLSGGLGGNYLATIAQLESSGDVNAQAKTSSAAGMFQITKGTLNLLNKKFGTAYTLDDRFDPKKATEMASLLTDDNRRVMESLLGRSPTDIEMYMAHMLGPSTANKMLRASRTTGINQVVSGAQFVANREFFTSNGRNKTVQEVIDSYIQKYNQRQNEVLAGNTTDAVKTLLGPGYASGTLGSTGKFFNDFGNGRLTMLHGQEAVLTPEQLYKTVEDASDATAKSFIGAGSQNGMGEMISSLNSNMSTLIGLTMQQLDISRSQLSVQKKLNPDMFMVS
jgi:hypothetical protein